MSDGTDGQRLGRGTRVAACGDRVTSRRGTLALGVAVMLVAASMRSPVTSLGALLVDVQDALGLSSALAGVLTSVPTLVFGLVGAAVPLLVRSLPTGQAITASMVLIATGTVVRASGSTVWLLVGTLVAMVGIAIVNVLLPVVVRSGFPSREGWMTGLYVSVLQIGAAAGASLSVPIANAAGGWRAGLAWWAVPAVVGAAAWLSSSRLASSHGRRDGAGSTLTWTRLVRDRTAVALTLLFGIQSAVAYVMMGWLPTIYRDAGLSPAAAGSMLAVAIVVATPASLLLPAWLARRPDQRAFVWIIGGPWAVGFAGLVLVPTTVPYVWAVLIGFGLASFPVALLLMGLRSATAADTRQVSAFAQGVGYLVALPAPLLFGVLHDATGGWTVPVSVLLVLLVPLMWFGLEAGRATHIGSTHSH